MSEEYIKAIKKERDEWKKKYQDLKEEIRTSGDDSMIGKRLKQWIKDNDTKSLHESYDPDWTWICNKMKYLVDGELHD